MVELTDKTHTKLKDDRVVLTNDGRIHVFFEPHLHTTLDRNDLEGTGEASAVSLYAQCIKKGAEKIQEGLSGDLTEKQIGEGYTAEHEARLVREAPVEEEEKEEIVPE